MVNRFFLNIKSLFFENKTFKQTIIKNTFWLGLAEVIDRGLGFLVVILVARHFGPEVYGQWSFAINFVMIFLFFSDFGFNTIAIREVAKDKSKSMSYIDNILFMKLILGIMTFALIVIFAQFLGKELQIVRLVYSLGVYLIINTFFTFFRSIFQANEKMQYETFCRAIQSFSEVLMVVFLIFYKSSIVAISYAFIVATLLGILFSLFFIWNYFSKFFRKIDLNICREIIKESWPIAINGFVWSMYASFGIILLSLLKTNDAVGLYNVAYGLVPALMVIPNLFMSSIYPRLCSVHKQSENDFKKILSVILKYTLIITPIFLFLVFILSEKIIMLLYGRLYVNSVVIFRILLFAVLFDYLGCIFTAIFYSTNKQMVYTKLMVGFLLLNIILCSLLIPKYSYIGLSIAMLISDSLLVSTSFLILKKTSLKGLKIRSILKGV